MSTPSSSSGLALHVAAVQFLFATTWTVYVLYLPSLAEQAGLARRWIPWILAADQVVFAVTDVLVGFWMDRARAAISRFGPWMLGTAVVSGLAFLLLPFAHGRAELLLASLLVWAVTSAALRSPPWLLLSRHAAAPSVPWLAALVLLGSGLASAAAPYLGLLLKGVDARLPFLVSTATLVVTVGALVVAERRAVPQPIFESPGEKEKQAIALPGPFFAALLLLAVGFQLHFAVNSAPRYARLAAAELLPWLMPVFWVGFNLLMFPATVLAKRLGLRETMALGAAAGSLAILVASFADGLPGLVAAQFLAGGCWGAASACAYSIALQLGRTGREGRFLGTLFAALALAAFARIAAVAGGLPAYPAFQALAGWLPQAAWLFAALLLLAGGRTGRA